MIKIKDDQVKVSVRNLVEFILRSGDLDNRRMAGSDKDAMQAGSRIHRKIQKRMGSFYRAEVSMKIEIPFQDYTILVEGRADGVIEEEQGVTIDEIKGVFRNLDFMESPVFVHQAQAMCYAHIYCEQHDCEEITVQMTYCNLESEQIKRFSEKFTKDYLERWFMKLIRDYGKWVAFAVEARRERNLSIKELQFPFAYRKGQRDVAVSVYKAIHRKKDLFVQAPTGVGKTISTIFPSVKAMGEGLGEKIFYLTAKTITRTVAFESLERLKEKGLVIRYLILTAKDKMCVCDEVECNPDMCERAKGHFDRVNEAAFALLQEERAITREMLLEWAERYFVCPYELSLDVSSWVDVIICDYNYAFDPTVYLKRFFGESVAGDYIFLVDEAHNLVERAREMYSAVLYKESFLEVKRLLDGQFKKVDGLLTKCNKTLLNMKKECDGYQVRTSIGNFQLELMKLHIAVDQLLEDHGEFDGKKQVVEFYLQVCNFLNMYELLDDAYEIYTEIEENGNFKVKLYCINPSHNLRNYLDKGNSTIFFSATLLPIRYYKELLSGNQDDYAIYIESPFDKKNRMLAVGSDVSSKYTRRGYEEYYKIFQYLDGVVDQKKGNYMIFFPSYALMEAVYEIALDKGFDLKADIIVQEANMTEASREDFLNQFAKDNKKSLAAFCVMGGIFSEGIDLEKDLLIGVLIVGTGLPQVCPEREILKEYFEQQNLNGFEYAYLYPGMNKVLQSAGRVIRTHEDKGVILLLDERFRFRQYQNLFPKEWEDYKVVNRESMKNQIEAFWNEADNTIRKEKELLK